jgi:hypothetical protein
MFVFGILFKYVPFLAGVSNQLIGWVNVVSYILVKTFAPPAHAGVLDGAPDAIGSLILGAFGNASVAFVLFEGWGRNLLSNWLKLKKPVPVVAPTPAA